MKFLTAIGLILLFLGWVTLLAGDIPFALLIFGISTLLFSIGNLLTLKRRWKK
jgi:hypothetical protein